VVVEGERKILIQSVKKWTEDMDIIPTLLGTSWSWFKENAKDIK